MDTSFALNSLATLRVTQKSWDSFIEALNVKDLDINQPSSKSQLAIIEATKIKEVRFVDALIQYGAIVQVKDPNTCLLYTSPSPRD